jgi:tetratricopeptide (TPR) repeat protein
LASGKSRATGHVVPPSPALKRAFELANQRSFPEAEAILRERLAEEPDDEAALDLLGFVLYFQGGYAEAEACCRRAILLTVDNAYATKGLGLCVAKQGRTEEAIALLERAVALCPAWFDAYWDWAVVHLEAGDRQGARDVVARARIALPAREADWQKLLNAIDRP